MEAQPRGRRARHALGHTPGLYRPRLTNLAAEMAYDAPHSAALLTHLIADATGIAIQCVHVA